jgi:hypothetical protein
MTSRLAEKIQGTLCFAIRAWLQPGQNARKLRVGL